MTRMISLSILALFAIVAAGAALTVLYMQKITGGYTQLTEFHRGEDIQRELAVSVQTVRSDLYTVRTPFAATVDSIVENMGNLRTAAGKCSGCHHTEEIAEEIQGMIAHIAGFENALSQYITAAANKERIGMLRDEALSKGNEILTHTNEMLLQASSKLEQKGTATLAEINNAKRFIYITIILTFLSAIAIAVKLIRSIKRPISELLAATQSIASGNLGHTVSYSDASDFGQLAKNFNAMSQALQVGYEKLAKEIRFRQEAERLLQKAYDEMERRVDERTIEIRQANIMLQEEIIDREAAEEKVRASLQEKELLLKEVHHRVKNNMQVISSLLSFQSDTIDDTRYRTMFLECQNRIKAMSLVHEKLYHSQDIGRIDFNSYLRSLAAGLYNFYGSNSSRISLQLDVEDVSFTIDTAIPCGLIVNELIANCLKHAFPNVENGTITVALRKAEPGEKEEDRYELDVRDNGIGLPADLNVRETTSVGLQIVRILAEHQLQGSMKVRSNGGTEFRILFRERKSSRAPAGNS